jgi:Spx/MgsR family transcriptional regulator
MITVYGLKNCDTCRKARQWLDGKHIDHRFHDLRADGLDEPTVAGWVKELGFEALLNTRGTTWRGLPESARAEVDAARATRLMHQHPALIKRPVFDLGKKRLVGFTDGVKKVLAAG